MIDWSIFFLFRWLYIDEIVCYVAYSIECGGFSECSYKKSCRSKQRRIMNAKLRRRRAGWELDDYWRWNGWDLEAYLSVAKSIEFHKLILESWFYASTMNWFCSNIRRRTVLTVICSSRIVSEDSISVHRKRPKYALKMSFYLTKICTKYSPKMPKYSLTLRGSF